MSEEQPQTTSEASKEPVEEKAESESKAPIGPGVDITPQQDGGVMKDIKREGTGEERPQPGDEVYVHYVGTLTNGDKFDSSRDRGEQFHFQLARNKVIKAWDIGIATMKRGELAVLTCRGDYAYGTKGSPPKIGPNETLVFEVELFDWKGEDISPDKDGSITRRELVAGSGYDKPNDGATVEIHLKGYHGDQVFQDEDIAFIVGEASEVGVVPGIEAAVKKFKKGEKSELKMSASQAYGQEGSKEYNIPPNADLKYEVTLNKFEKAKEHWEMDSAEKIEQSEIAKGKGTVHFKDGKYHLAVKYYKKVLDYLQYDDKLEECDKKKGEALKLAAHLNLAMCYIKQGEYHETIEHCEKALELDSGSEKAYFRRATARSHQQDFEDAMSDFKRVLDIDPNNKAAKNQMILCQQRLKQAHEKEKKTYAGMFTKFAQIDAKKDEKNKTKYGPGDLFTDVGEWDNDLAKGMMPLDQEMAAFGEKMPEPKYNQGDEGKENENPDVD